MNCEEARQSLDAYVDGELELNSHLAIEAHLAECISCKGAAKRITNCSSIVRLNMPAYKAPPELKAKVRATLRKEDLPRFQRLTQRGHQIAYAAALVILCCALGGIWFSLSATSDQELIADAISNHSRSLMVSHLVDCASDDQHTVRPWFNGKLDYSPPVADLAGAGYTLVGGRVDILEQRPVGAIVYRHGKHVINLFIWPATGRKIEIEVQAQRGYHFCGWNKGGWNFFCVSEISASDLESFEDEVREHANL